MTIFVKAAKALIDRVLNKSMEESIASDNTLLSFFRNTELSDKQREFTRDLQKKIDLFISLGKDKDSLDALKKIISETDSVVEKYRETKQWGRGHLNNTLEEINSKLERFFKVLSNKEFQLVDIEDSQKPFHILCAHAAYYLGEEILCPAGEGLVAKAVNALSAKVSSASSVEIRSQKEACLIRNIINCKKKLDALDTEKEGYNELCKTFVIEAIDTIKRENAEICEESKPVTSIPVQVSVLAVVNFKASGIKPSRGRLRVVMENALDDINDLEMPKAEVTRVL